jgi:hypothetical protein
MYPTDIDADLAHEFVEHRARDYGVKVQLLLAPIDDAGAAAARKARVPEPWVRALAQTTLAPALTELGWDQAAAVLPRTTAALHERLSGLGVMLARGEPPSLIYFFAGVEDVGAFEGFAPKAAAPRKPRPRPSELAPLQAIHDGWFEFYSGEVGWMPEEDWEVMGEKGETFTAVAMKGSAMAGFETATLQPHVLLPDEQKVETPASLAALLDEWSVDAIDEAD